MFPLFKKKNAGSSTEFAIKGMHCPSCALNIDGALEDTPGIKSASTSFAKARVFVEFDPTTISEETIKKVIQEQGYQASDLK
ncbi:heavy-metal-associated domain-containing protein [Candidatus Woesebacteria bacterium]|nr:heavy-metal-associated domain-containing protein [Candidatus Woesebacteria bacterium]